MTAQARPHQEKQVSKEELQQLSKSFRIFNKIYKLAEELDKCELDVSKIIKDKISKKQIEELVGLIQKITAMPHGYTTPFQRKFYDEELQNSPILNVLKEYHSAVHPMEYKKFDNTDTDTASHLGKLLAFLGQLNAQTANIESHINGIAKPSDNMRMLSEAFHTECAAEKKKHIKETLSIILNVRDYAEKGPEWAAARTFEFVSWASNFSTEDRELFMDCLLDQLKSGQLCYDLIQRYPPRK